MGRSASEKFDGRRKTSESRPGRKGDPDRGRHPEGNAERLEGRQARPAEKIPEKRAADRFHRTMAPS
jgi:hypothetical protein